MIHFLYVIGDYEMEEAYGDMDIPWEPADHGQNATGGITGCRKFWRIFVRNSLD